MNVRLAPHPIDVEPVPARDRRWLGYATIIAADLGLIALAMVIALGVPLDALAF